MADVKAGMGAMRVAVALSPEGVGFVVSEVAVERGGRVEAWHDSWEGAVPSPERYASLEEFVRRNSRSMTSAMELELRDGEDPRMLVGQPADQLPSSTATSAPSASSSARR